MAINKLRYEMLIIHKVLIIAPKKVAEGTWTAERDKWENFSRLRVVTVLGSEKTRIEKLHTVADIYVINRENVQWLVKYYKNKWPFDVVVLDESSSFKNHRAKRFMALKAVRPHIRRMIELTGTPSPKGLTDLWAQIFLLDGGRRLGRTVSCYRDIYFVPDKRNASTIYSYTPKKGAEEEIYERLSDICISMKSEDYLTLPDMIIDDIPVTLDAKAKKAYDEMEKTMLLEVDDNEITASNAATLTGKLLQLCNGAIYNTEKEVIPIHDCKIEAFMETVEQLCGQHAVVYYYFKHDHDRLVGALAKTSLRVRTYTHQKDLDDWNDGKIDILLAQPASCGYGLNLQQGGHHIIWFGLTWSLEEYQQANKRLHRQGQQHPVIIHRLITRGGTDEDVIRALGRKDGVQSALLDALKARIERAKK